MAGVEVGRLEVVLGVDTKPLTTGVDKAQKAVADLGKEVSSVGRNASSDFDRIEQVVRDLMRAVDRGTDTMSSGFKDVQESVKHLESSLNKAEKEVKDLDTASKKAGGSMKDMADKMTSVGTKMSMAVTAPMVAAGVAAMKMANDFEFAMASITGLVGISEQEVASMEGSVRDMAVQFGRSGVEAAEGLYFITSAGIKGADAMGVLEQSLKASAVGLGETMIIADSVSSALNAYGIENLSAAQATDAMVAAVREGKMEADALAGALPRVLPIASSMGVSFEEVSAAFAAMSRNGTDANEAATQIRGILASLLNPTKQAEEQLTAMGLSSQGLRESIKEDGLLSTLEVLTQAFGNNEEAAGIVFGNIRALTGVMSLFGSATASTEAIFANLTDNTGDLDKAFTAMSNTGTFKANQAMAAMKDSLISLGQTIGPIVLPIISTLANAVAKVAETFSSLPGPIKTVVVILGGLLAAAGPVLIAVGALAKAWLALKAAMATQAVASAVAQLTAAGPIIAGIAIAVTAVAVAWSVFSNNAKEAQERQERLTASLKAAGDETALLVDNVSALITEYEQLNGVDDVTNPLGATNGKEAFALTEIAAQGLTETFANMGVSLADVVATVETGTNWFDALAAELDLAEGNGTGMDAVLASMSDTGNALVDTLLHSVQAGEMTSYQFLEIVNALDSLSDAFDDNREQLNDDAKAMLTNSETAAKLADILGSDYLNQLLATSFAESKATGDKYEWATALDTVRVAVDAVINPLRDTTTAEVEVARAAVYAADGLVQLDGAMNAVRLMSEDGKVSVAALAEELKILGDLTANEVQLALLDAQDASDELYGKFEGLESGSRGVERAVREQLSSMIGLVAQVTSLGGSARDVAPTLAKMYNDMLSAAQAAGISRDRIVELIEQIGLLDGLSPEIRMYLTMDVAEVKANIEAVMRMFGGVTPGGELEARLKTRLAFLLDVLKLLEQKPTRSGGGGGGGSRRQTNPEDQLDFSWVEGWVSSIADTANSLISRDFADQLVSGSSKEIGKAFQDLLDKAFELKIDQLPAFQSLLNQLRSKFSQLANLADTRDLLKDQIDDANKALEDFKDTLSDVRKEADKFNVSSGLTSPTLSLLDQARAAQDKYDELYQKAEGLKASRASFLSTVEGAVNQPLSGRNPLSQTRKLLTQAKTFRDNLLALREKGFGPDVIRQVAEAGIVDGSNIAKGLLSLTGSQMAEFVQMRQQIQTIATEAGGIAADVLFGTDIADAEKALNTQRSLVAQLFTSAVTEAEANVSRQQGIVDGLNTQLNATEVAIRDLTYAIQTDLYNTFFGFLAGFQGGLDQLRGAPSRVPDATTGGGGTVSIMPVPEVTPIGRVIDDSALGGINWNDFGKWMETEANKLIPGKSYMDWNQGPLPNGGAIIGPDHIYLPPGLDFSGFMADGGIATRSTLVGVGEAGPEAIIPLSRLGAMSTGGDIYINVTVEGTVTSERDLVENIRQGLLKAQKNGKQVLI